MQARRSSLFFKLSSFSFFVVWWRVGTVRACVPRGTWFGGIVGRGCLAWGGGTLRAIGYGGLARRVPINTPERRRGPASVLQFLPPRLLQEPTFKYDFN